MKTRFKSEECITKFSLKNILPAVVIKPYCFKFFFEKHFYLNNRPFVFKIMDNYFDLIAKATKFEITGNSFA